MRGCAAHSCAPEVIAWPPPALACCQPCTGAVSPLIYGYFSFLAAAPAVSKPICVRPWQRRVFGGLQGARDQTDLSIPGQEEGGKGVPKLEPCQVLPALPHQIFCCWSLFCTNTLSRGCCEHPLGFPAECYMVKCLGCREVA